MQRRRFLTLIGASFALGCGKNVDALTCTDTTALAAEDEAARKQVEYVDRTTEVGKNCTTCQQYVEPKSSGTCGTCKVLKGPVHPYGNCKVYAKKA